MAVLGVQSGNMQHNKSAAKRRWCALFRGGSTFMHVPQLFSHFRPCHSPSIHQLSPVLPVIPLLPAHLPLITHQLPSTYTSPPALALCRIVFVCSSSIKASPFVTCFQCLIMPDLWSDLCLLPFGIVCLESSLRTSFYKILMVPIAFHIKLHRDDEWWNSTYTFIDSGFKGSCLEGGPSKQTHCCHLLTEV